MHRSLDVTVADDAGALILRLEVELDLPAAIVGDARERIRVPGGTSEDPRGIARAVVGALADAACAAGDQQAESRVARWRIDSRLDVDAVPRAAAWHAQLRALTHGADAARGPARTRLLRTLRERALQASADISAMADGDEVGDMDLRRLLDPIATVLVRVEAELGVAPSAPAAALAERHRIRAGRTADGPTFAARHAEDLARFRAEIAESWFRDRFLERHGVAPPAGWWTEAADGTPGGLSIEVAELFDAEDHVAFLEETEAAFRADRGLPPRGEGLVSAISLARCVEVVLPGVEIQREARRSWLGAQRLDIFLTAFDVAIEYQGEQHYLPLEHWGGDAGLNARRELDERKRDACARAGVRLIEWRYDEPISIDRVRRRLQDVGAFPLE